MLDIHRTITRWRRLGRVFPPEVRERIFEPAFYDAVRTWLQHRPRRGHVPLGVYALCTALRCAPIALPRFFISQGRLTKLSRMAIGVAAIGTPLLLALLVVLRPYLGYDH